MFLADGITNIPEMMKAGVTIGLGSDGACGNSRISVFEEMRMTALLQKANTLDAMSVNFKQVFQMGTENGGILTGLAVGSLKENCYADFVGINLHDLSMQPVGDNLEQLLPNIVYSMQPSAIKKVVVNGKLTVDDGRLVFVKEDKIVHLVEQSMMRLNA
jgi:5-methylthioadenosine/S-adenosylhomocysteine deaminase